MLGVAYLGISFLTKIAGEHVASSAVRMLISLVAVAVYVGLVYFFTRRHAQRYGVREGFSYGRGVGFVCAMMLFTGFLAGAWIFFQIKVLDPDRMEEMIAAAMVQYENVYSGTMLEQMEQMVRKMLVNPIFWLMVCEFSAEFYGCLIGLVVSAWTKRLANPFADEPNVAETQNSDNNQTEDN